VGLLASAWLVAAVRLGGAGLAAARPDAPWGPLEVVFPRFASTPGPYVLAASLGLVLLGLVAFEAWRARRRPARG
jgi:MYXO-CTERM domain-containing protein